MSLEWFESGNLCLKIEDPAGDWDQANLLLESQSLFFKNTLRLSKLCNLGLHWLQSINLALQVLLLRGRLLFLSLEILHRFQRPLGLLVQSFLSRLP
jgi:hypothetical protein